MTRTMPRVKERTNVDEQTVIGRATAGLADAGAQVVGASATVARSVPATVEGYRGAFDRMRKALQESTSGSLALGTFFAAGLTSAMLLSGAPRALVSLSFLPVLLLGGTVLGRATAPAGQPYRGGRS